MCGRAGGASAGVSRCTARHSKCASYQSSLLGQANTGLEEPGGVQHMPGWNRAQHARQRNSTACLDPLPVRGQQRCRDATCPAGPSAHERARCKAIMRMHGVNQAGWRQRQLLCPRAGFCSCADPLLSRGCLPLLVLLHLWGAASPCASSAHFGRDSAAACVASLRRGRAPPSRQAAVHRRPGAGVGACGPGGGAVEG